MANITLTNGADTYGVSSQQDNIKGLDGDDLLNFYNWWTTNAPYIRLPQTGGDTIDGGSGNDTIIVGSGDSIIGGSGDDVIFLSANASISESLDGGLDTVYILYNQTSAWRLADNFENVSVYFGFFDTSAGQ